jgi:hypothetical protein
MSLARPSIALDPRQFGRAPVRNLLEVRPETGLSNDLKLFATTFAAGFLFVSVMIS